MKLTKKVKILIASIAAAVVVLSGSITGIALHASANKPEKATVNSVGNLLEDFFDRHEVMHARELFNNGSIEVNFNSMKEADSTDSIVPYSGGGKLYLNTKGLFVDDLHISNGTETIRFNGMVSEDKAYIENEGIGGAFGYLKSNVNDLLSKLDKDAPYYKAVEAAVKVYANSITYGECKEEVQEILRNMYDKFFEFVFKHVEPTVTKDKALIHGEPTNCRIIKLEFTEVPSLTFMKEFFNYYRYDDKEIPEFFNKHQDTNNLILEIIKVAGGELKAGDTLLTLYYQVLDQAIASMEEGLKDAQATPSKAKVVLTVYTKPGKALVMRSDIELIPDEVEDAEKIIIQVGPKGMLKTNLITVTYQEATFKYEILQMDKEAFICKISFDDVDLFRFEINKKLGTWLLRVGEHNGPEGSTDESFIVKGLYEASKKSYKFKATWFKWADGKDDEFLNLDMDITFTEGVKLPEGATDIKPLYEGEEKFNEFMEKFMAELNKVFTFS